MVEESFGADEEDTSKFKCAIVDYEIASRASRFATIFLGAARIFCRLECSCVT